jgi:hypothetical protein
MGQQTKSKLPNNQLLMDKKNLSGEDKGATSLEMKEWFLMADRFSGIASNPFWVLRQRILIYGTQQRFGKEYKEASLLALL